MEEEQFPGRWENHKALLGVREVWFMCKLRRGCFPEIMTHIKKM
jgi:hypothetical protein